MARTRRSMLKSAVHGCVGLAAMAGAFVVAAQEGTGNPQLTAQTMGWANKILVV